MLPMRKIPRHYWATIVWRSTQGAILGCGAPLGWAIIQSASGVDPVTDLQQNTVLYLYMLLGTISVFIFFGAYFGLQECHLKETAFRDHLTKLFNLRYFREQLDLQMAQAERDKLPLCLIYFDFDHFKQVNDTYGHAAGDIVLTNVSKRVSTILRRNELFARIGGEEFAIIILHDPKENAAQLAERIRETVEKQAIRIEKNRKIRITISAGVVQAQQGESPSELVDRADCAMYQAKKQGRNKVVVA